MGVGVPLLDCKLYLLMTDKILNIPKSEAFTWLQPGTWRKPCIVHVTMVANSRQALFGKLTYNGSEAVVEKTPIGWALINQERRLLELSMSTRASVWAWVDSGTCTDIWSPSKSALKGLHTSGCR